MGIHFTHRSGGPCWSRELGYHQPAPLPDHIMRMLTTPAPKPAPKTDFCWLVELFEPDGNSMGYYHTGFTTLMPGESRTTKNPHEAKRYATQAEALHIADGLHHLAGVWRAVEHGFDA